MQEKMHELDWSAKGEEEGRGGVTEATLPGTLRGAWSKQRHLLPTEVPGGHLGNVSVAVGGAPGEPGGGGQGCEIAEINHEPTSLCSGIFGERLPLRYYLTGGMLLSGLFTSLFGLGYFWNIHVLWYFVLVQVRAFSGLHSGDPAAPGHSRSRPGLLYHTVGSPAHSQGSLAGSGSQPEVPGGACEARSLPWGPGVRGTSAGGCVHVCEGRGGMVWILEGPPSQMLHCSVQGPLSPHFPCRSSTVSCRPRAGPPW